MIITWGIHVVVSLFIFYLGPKWLRAAFRQIHMSLGFAYSIAMLLVILAGIVYEEVDMSQLPGTTSILTYVYQKTKACAISLLILMFNIYLALYSKPVRPKRHPHPPNPEPNPHPPNPPPNPDNLTGS